MDLPVDQIAQAARQGSPTALHAFGRMFGLGQAERQALFRGDGIPGWALLGIGLLGGTLAGMALAKKWPRQTDKILGGGR